MRRPGTGERRNARSLPRIILDDGARREINAKPISERPSDRRAYTHKLNCELDTSVAVLNWLPEGRGGTRHSLAGVAVDAGQFSRGSQR